MKILRITFVLCILLDATAGCAFVENLLPRVYPVPTSAPTPPNQLDAVTGPTTIWYVIDSLASVRACASEDCEIIVTTSFGKRLAVLETVNGWHRVRLAGGESGWIEADFTSQSTVCKSCE